MEAASAVPSWPSEIIVGRKKKAKVLHRMDFDRSFDSNGSPSAARMEGLYVQQIKVVRRAGASFFKII